MEEKTGTYGFWDNREEAEKVFTALKREKSRYEPWEELKKDFESTAELYDIACSERDESITEEIEEHLAVLEKKYGELRTKELLGDEVDEADAFLTIHSGAGGTEACDWVSMLLRMYSRWAELKEYSLETLDLMEAEGGIKSITLQMSGPFAYGFLKGETGVHRLVRISPFDSGGRRHTSFASVFASPVLEDEIELDIRPEDLRIDTYRSSGAGGQHVNKTDSAVRITHIETGVVVQCQNERSQHKNKAMAMKILKSRLYEYYRDKKEEEKEKNSAEKKEISWGSQIRSYVFQPYTLVKDHRTKLEVGNINSVMDGFIDPFIEEYLKYQWKLRG